MKILVIGFQRSGTTLLRRLIQQHPQVKFIAHERILLKHLKKELINLYGKKDNWGEKVPWYTTKIKRGFNGNIIDYCNKWNSYFNDEARIIHIVRYPLDVAISNIKKYKHFDINKVLTLHKEQMLLRIPQLQKFENCLQIKFENLVCEPHKTLQLIYSFCELNSTNQVLNKLSKTKAVKFETINCERAFAYKNRESILYKTNFEESLDILNQIQGIKYERSLW